MDTARGVVREELIRDGKGECSAQGGEQRFQGGVPRQAPAVCVRGEGAVIDPTFNLGGGQGVNRAMTEIGDEHAVDNPVAEGNGARRPGRGLALKVVLGEIGAQGDVR